MLVSTALVQPVLKSLRESNRQMQAELHQHKLFQMQQAQQQRTPEPDPQVDPDVERVIAPVVRKALKPLEEENQNLRGQLMGLADQARVQANIDYIERNIPNFEEVRAELAKEIESMPKADQDLVLSSPTLMVKLAQSLNSQRGKSTRQEARSRNFTESSTGTSPTKNSSALGNVDWSSLSDAEFAAKEAQIEQARRRR
jgi:hypothetical protein